MEFEHVSVLFQETLNALAIKDHGVYADGTLGGGGHSFGILSSNPSCRIIGIDQDEEALRAAGQRLEPFKGRTALVKDNFKNIRQILQRLQEEGLDGGVLDLGVSSYQLDNEARGFSYMHDAPLDMRMDQEGALDAYQVVNTYSEEALSKIFFEYGEEKWAKRIAKFIIQARAQGAVETTGALVALIKAAIPKGARMEGGHPAKRVFQAIRIEVNGELSLLEQALEDFVQALKPGGRLAVITFHSLEDRITKQTFARLAQGCVCPKEFPVCVCNHRPVVKLITRKPVLPSEAEREENSRSKSAKLRVVEKL